MQWRREVGVLALGLWVAGCASPGGSPAQVAVTGAPTPTRVASAVPASAPSPADLIVGGERPVTLELPSPAPQEPMPLLLLLHGFGSNGTEQDDYMRLGREALRRGIAFATPEGTKDSNGARFWNATDACCDIDRSGVDDAGYLTGLIEEIRSVADIDPDRIYLVGHSNGGFMSHRMACDHADLVAAIVSLAGTMPDAPSDCTPSEPVAVLQIHGTDDDTIRYEGGDLNDIVGANGAALNYPGALETATVWASLDGCASELDRAPERVDIEITSGPSGPAETTIDVATGCDPGGHVELWTIPDGGHAPNLDASFAVSVLDFLLEHPKP
jgi:polyhydroxybutyrate depolymerase